MKTNTIDPNKKYTYLGEPVSVIGDDPPLVVIRTKSGNYGAVDPTELKEIPEAREPREEPDTMWSMIVEIRDRIRGIDGVREILPEPTLPDLTELHAEGREAWKDVPNATEWVEQQRGNAPEPLTLEVGKWYENRRGDKVGPLELGDPKYTAKEFPFWVGEKGFRVNGQFNWEWETPQESPEDLIREIPAPSAFPPVPETPGFRKVNRGFGWLSNGKSHYLTAQKDFDQWSEYFSRQTDAVPDSFYIELIPYTGEEAGSAIREGQQGLSDTDEGQTKTVSETFGKALGVDGPKLAPQASYPPPESEWPEMPDAGEGMVWERQKQSGHYNETSNYITLMVKLNGMYVWDDSTTSEYSNCVVFRAVPKPPEQTEESRAKAALEDGWLWFGRGPIKGHSKPSSDVAIWNRFEDSWRYGETIGNFSELYAIRAGTDLAKANGLEPAEPRYRELGEEEVIAEKDEWWNCARWVECYKSVGHPVGTMRRVRRLVTEPGEVQRWIVDESRADESDAGDWVRHSEYIAAIEALIGNGGAK